MPDSSLDRLSLGEFAGAAGFIDIIDDALKGQLAPLHSLASGLLASGRHDQALAVCELILRDAPGDTTAHILSLRALAEQGRAEQVLERLIALRDNAPGGGMGGEELWTEMRRQLAAAGALHETCLAAGEYERAVAIIDLLARLCPGVLLFQQVRVSTRALLQNQRAAEVAALQRDYFISLGQAAEACHAARDLAGELEYRLAIHRHPLGALQPSVLRISNLASALSRVLDVAVDDFPPERLALARELLNDMRATPRDWPQVDDLADNSPDCWQRSIRVLLETIDLDQVFGPPAEPTPLLPTYFFAASGVAMNLAAVMALCRERAARVVFSTSTSREYFAKYARTYVSSILKTVDCSCLILIVICAPVEQVAEMIAQLGIDDPRLVFCCDNIDPAAARLKLYEPSRGQPMTHPGIYFACAALFRLDIFLPAFQIPVLVTGIDTVLQRGVVDLVEGFAQADIVINMGGSNLLLGAQLVNNLVMAYPTPNAMLFARFLKRYLGHHVAQPEQPSYLDQLDLHMAKFHLQAQGTSPAIRYFDEYDINNVMFNHLNFQAHFERMKKYRFLNMFVGAYEEERLTVEDVTA